jgi:hypothetical protein
VQLEEKGQGVGLELKKRSPRKKRQRSKVERVEKFLPRIPTKI